MQCLSNKCWGGASVVWPHTRSVGVEDPRDCGVHAVRGAVRDSKRLGETLGLVVDTTRANRVDITPVAFGLRVHLGVSINFGRRSEEEPGLLLTSEFESVQGAERSDL